MSLENFRALLKEYLRRAGYSQKDLATQLVMHPSLLSNKLNERNYATLTYAEVKQIVMVLDQWRALNNAHETLALLGEMGLDESSFSQSDTPKLLSRSPQRRAELALPFRPRTLYGRQRELDRLEQAVFAQKARLVGLTGLGGIGKSALAATFAYSVQDSFELVVWYSLWNAPPFHTALTYFLNMLRGGESLSTPAPGANEPMHQQLGELLECLQQTRCLLILDNFETVLASGQASDPYLSGYEGYGRLVQLVGEQFHQSCVLLTSREKPLEMAILERRYPERVLSLSVGGLSAEEGRRLLEEEPYNDGSTLNGSAQQWEELVRYYSGHPLALKLLAEPLQKLFGGSISTFLTHGWVVVGDLDYLLKQQLQRLSELEQALLYWLAVERQALSLEELKADFRETVSRKELGEGLVSLRRRSLIEESGPAGYFGLQPVIMEYLTEQLIEQVVAELKQAKVEDFLANYALLKAETKDYIRQSQRKLILLPILNRLQLALKSREAVIQRLWHLVAQVRQQELEEQGYEGGNLLNLLVELKAELRGADFSGLRLWQAYLQGVRLEGVNLAWCEVRGAVFTNAFSAVEAVAFSPLGHILASGGLDGTVRLWEVATGQCLAVFQGHAGRVWSVAFSPAGQLLASGSADHTIILWDLANQQPLTTLKGHSSEIQSVAFSPDGKLLLASGSTDYTLRLWDIASGECLKVLEGHSNEVWAVAFSPDGRTLASGSADGTIRLWEPGSGQCLKILKGANSWVWSVSFSPDGKLLASGSSDQSVRLWEMESGQCLSTLVGHTNRVYAVAFSPDGRLVASGSSDQSVRLWEVESGHCLKVLEGHLNLIKSLVFSPDGKLLASGSPDQSIRLWEVGSGLCVRIFEGYSNRINAVVYSPDGQYLANGSDDYTIRLWETASRSLSKTLPGQNFVKSLAFSPNGKVLASGGADNLIRLWDLASGQCYRILRGYPSWVWSLAFSPDGRLLANGGNDNTIYLWDSASGQCLKVLQGHTNFVRKVVFSPDGKLLASASQDQTIRLWEAGSWQCRQTLEGHSNIVFTLAFSPDGQVLASGSADQSIRLWNIPSGECFKIVEGHTNWAGTVAFSPDGQYLASSGYDGRVVVWEAKSGEYLFDLHGHTGVVRSLTFKPDGTYIAGGDEHYLRVWDLYSREVVQVMKNPGPYEGLNIFGVSGLSRVQEANLVALGALWYAPK